MNGRERDDEEKVALGSLFHLSCWLIRCPVFLVSAAIVSSGVPSRHGTAGMKEVKNEIGRAHV